MPTSEEIFKLQRGTGYLDLVLVGTGGYILVPAMIAAACILAAGEARMNSMMLPLLLLCPRPLLLAAAASAVRGSFDGFPQGPPNAGHCDPCFAPSTQVLQLTGWALDTSLAGGGVPPVRDDTVSIYRLLATAM